MSVRFTQSIYIHIDIQHTYMYNARTYKQMTYGKVKVEKIMKIWINSQLFAIINLKKIKYLCAQISNKHIIM